MVNQENYITEYWNLKDGSGIDWERTISTFHGKEPWLELSLVPTIRKCASCGSGDVSVIKTRKREVRAAVKDGSVGTVCFRYRVYRCAVCGRHMHEEMPLAGVHRGISRSVDMGILESLRDITLTYDKVADRYGVSDAYAIGLFDRYVDAKRRALPNVLSIDEVYSKRLTRTKYCCVIYDPRRDKVVDMMDSRRIGSLRDYFSRIPLEERLSVDYFTSDLCETYRTVHREFFPNSVHAADSFHVVKNLSDLFNDIRVGVMKRHEYEKEWSNSSYWLFKKFFKLLFLDESEIEDKEYRFRKFDMVLDRTQLIEEMLKVDDGLRQAYRLMVEYKNFNRTCDYANAREMLDEQISNFQGASTEEMRRFGFLLSNWREEIVNSFARVDGWRLSNGKMENANRKIKLMFANAYGYSNFARARNRVLYSYNGDVPLLNTCNIGPSEHVQRPTKKAKVQPIKLRASNPLNKEGYSSE